MDNGRGRHLPAQLGHRDLDHPTFSMGGDLYQKHFQAIEIQSGKPTPVLAIKETTGRTYLPTMSSLPECNKKVIQGYITPDTIFVTAKVVRDTTIPTVGQ